MIVKEHIYERFTQDSDPIEDMDIGVFKTHKNFNTYEEAYDFFIDIIPLILNTKEILRKLVRCTGYYICPGDLTKLCNYVNNYLTIGGEKFYPTGGEIHHYLKMKHPRLFKNKIKY